MAGCSTTHRASLLSLVAISSVVAATPSLDLRVTGAVDAVENFKVVATLTNTGDEKLRLLNDPHGILHPLPANVIIITANDGSSPNFTGVRVKYSLDDVARMSAPSVFNRPRAGPVCVGHPWP